MIRRTTSALQSQAAFGAVAIAMAVCVFTGPKNCAWSQDEIVPVPDLTGQFPGTAGEEDDWFGYEAPLQFGFQGGETYVNPDWLFTVEKFQPIGNRQIGRDEIITYVDARFGIGQERRIANFGTGIRHFNGWLDTISDVNIWYDYDWTEANRFEQVTFGGQVQNRWLTARLHIYEPIGDDLKAARFSATDSTPVFVAQQLSFSRFRVDELAYEGFDAEVGGILTTPWSESRLYCGIYHFENDNGEHELDGVSARVEQDLGAGWVASLGVTNDDVTDTSVMFRMTWEIGGVPRGYFGNTIKHRLAEAPRRNYNIVIQEQTTLDALIATNATTGNPINVIHVSSLVGGTGDGSVERPFTSLADAAASAAGTTGDDIILAHAGSVFDGQGIALPDNTRFLGDGIDHMVDTTEFGTLTLPRANALTATPIIANAPGIAIQLANEVELNNIDVQNATGDGVLANAVSGNVTVTDVSIDGAADGLSIRSSDSNAVLTFNDVSIANTTSEGIDLDNNDGGSTITFTGLTTVDATSRAAFLINGGAPAVTVGALQLTNYEAQAIQLLSTGGLIDFTSPLVLDRTVLSPESTIEIGSSTGTISFDDVSIGDSLAIGAGANATVSLTNNEGTISFDSLAVTSVDRTALRAVGGGIADRLRIDAGTLSSTNATALSLNNLTNWSVTLQRVSATNATRGIELIGSGAAATSDVFRIVGTGTGSGDGGSITDVDVGVYIEDSDDIFLNFLDIDSRVAGIQVLGTTSSLGSKDISLNSNRLQSTSNDWVGIDFEYQSGSGSSFSDNFVTNNTITGDTGSNQVGINLMTSGSFVFTTTFGGNSINLSGANSTGVNLDANGVGNFGVIDLSSTGADNTVMATVPFMATENVDQNDDDITGQILINGTLQPPGP